MALTRKCFVGKEVICTQDGRMGVVTREDGFKMYITFRGTPETAETKIISSSTFDRHYKVIEDGEPLPREKKQRRAPFPKGKPGAGNRLFNVFMTYVKQCANQDLEVFTSNDRNYTIVKYNEHNVFQLRTASRWLTVYCNPKSLCASNKARIVSTYPQNFRRALTARFTFADDSDLPLMRSIIVDGLFYRQIVITEEDVED